MRGGHREAWGRTYLGIRGRVGDVGSGREAGKKLIAADPCTYELVPCNFGHVTIPGLQGIRFDCCFCYVDSMGQNFVFKEVVDDDAYMYMYTGPMTLGTLGVQATGYRLQADMHANCYLLQKYL